jgi:hypothetical protein
VWDVESWKLKQRISVGKMDQVNTLSFGFDWMTGNMKVLQIMMLFCTDSCLGSAAFIKASTNDVSRLQLN